MKRSLAIMIVGLLLYGCSESIIGDSATQDPLMMRLPPIEVVGAFEAQRATTLVVDGARIVLPASAFVDAEGQTLEGTVTYQLSYLSRDELEGSVYAGGDALDLRALLVAEFSREGERVDLADGAIAELEIPIGAALDEGDRLEMVVFDPIAFGWVADGLGQVEAASDGSSVWQAQVSHFSVWGVAAGTVEVCHIPPGNVGNAHTIEVGLPAVPAHLDHGDTRGACPSDDVILCDPDDEDDDEYEDDEDDEDDDGGDGHDEDCDDEHDGRGHRDHEDDESTECPEGMVCADDGHCVEDVTPCETDADCAEDEVCAEGGCTEETDDPNACDSNEDCPDNFVCSDGECRCGSVKDPLCPGDP